MNKQLFFVIGALFVAIFWSIYELQLERSQPYPLSASFVDVVSQEDSIEQDFQIPALKEVQGPGYQDIFYFDQNLPEPCGACESVIDEIDALARQKVEAASEEQQVSIQKIIDEKKELYQSCLIDNCSNDEAIFEIAIDTSRSCERCSNELKEFERLQNHIATRIFGNNRDEAEKLLAKAKEKYDQCIDKNCLRDACMGCDDLQASIEKNYNEYSLLQTVGDYEAAVAILKNIQREQVQYRQCLYTWNTLRVAGECKSTEQPEHEQLLKDCPDCAAIDRQLQNAVELRYEYLAKDLLDEANKILREVSLLRVFSQNCWQQYKVDDEVVVGEDNTTNEGEEAKHTDQCVYPEKKIYTYQNESGDVFTDIPLGHHYYASTKYLYNSGVLKGYEDGRYDADGLMNRAEFIKAVVEARGEDIESDINNACFKDVYDQWFAPYVCYAFDQGWVSGYENELFDPSRTINRGEALKVLFHAFEIETLEYAYEDFFVDVENTQWFQPYVYTAYNAYILDSEGQYFYAAQPLSRGVMAEWIYRFLLSREVGDLHV